MSMLLPILKCPPLVTGCEDPLESTHKGLTTPAIQFMNSTTTAVPQSALIDTTDNTTAYTNVTVAPEENISATNAPTRDEHRNVTSLTTPGVNVSKLRSRRQRELLQLYWK